jgi:predicted AAA+ superfamily ATPase
MEGYKPRVADQLLADLLEACGCVQIKGSKWCGKSTTAEQLAKSVVYMADPADGPRNIQIAQSTPKFLLQGETPRLIDEWQVVPTLWDAIRGEVDHRRAVGQFIITGSAVPADKSKIVHTGTGRIAPLVMRPMSLWESGDSSGELSLASLFEQPEQLLSESKIDIEELAYLVCRGGWPLSTITPNSKAALKQAKIYYEGVVGSGNGEDSDISRADGIRRNPDRVKRLMRSLSRNLGTQASLDTIYQDMIINDKESLDKDTISSYISALKMIFVVEDMRAWNPNLRSRTAIRTADTRYFVDPSIAAAALGLGPKDLINDLETFGLFFETMAVRDLRVYGDALGGTVYHYRDKNNLECDAVLHLENGNYGLIEIKLGGEDDIEKGATVLKDLADKIDTTRMKNPSFMMVLVGLGRYAYRREDGVYIVPIGCLKP